ncbi:MAG: hypothetical protein JW938_04020 [Candidatus Omnitrophica bacterium]|nr:hypothetical protein [Candidatus Omnitrophota bacterium]
MKTHHVLLIILGIVFGLMIGSFLFGISMGLLDEEAVINEIRRLYDHRFITFLVSLFLFYASYVVTRTLIKRATREEIFITEGEFGRVSISIFAVNDVVRKVFRKFDYITKYRLDTYVQQKKLVVKILIKEWDGRSVNEMTAAVMSELKAKLHKIMGLEGNIEVHIKINKLNDDQELKAIQER